MKQPDNTDPDVICHEATLGTFWQKCLAQLYSHPRPNFCPQATHMTEKNCMIERNQLKDNKKQQSDQERGDSYKAMFLGSPKKVNTVGRK